MGKAMASRKVKRIHPKKFALWIALVSATMMFTALTSAYIVRRSGGSWYNFEMPTSFLWSTATIILSSAVLHLAYKFYVKREHSTFKGLLIIGFALGLAFVCLQYLGWQDLISQDIRVNLNPSSSFLYLITGLHVVHVIGGMGALGVVLIHARRKVHNTVTESRKLRLELVFTYWHFVDFLWIYLYLFFLVQQ